MGRAYGMYGGGVGGMRGPYSLFGGSNWKTLNIWKTYTQILWQYKGGSSRNWIEGRGLR
jgi:hypothetical protein